MFISSKLKNILKANINCLIEKQKKQELLNRQIINKIEELSKKIKPTEIPDFEGIFTKNKPKKEQDETFKCFECKNYTIDQNTKKYSCIYANKKDCEFEKIEEK